MSLRRDSTLADRLMHQVRACSQAACALLVCPDGWNASPKSIQRAFRDKVKQTLGRGRACVQVWLQVCIATVITHVKHKRVVQITRTMTLGTLAQAQQWLQATGGGSELNTAFLERFNGTMRERLACLTRTCRHAAHRIAALSSGMYLIGCASNWCFAHHEVSNSKHCGHPCTPAMASGLTDHIWSISELLSFKVAPAPWVAPKRRGRPRKATGVDPTVPTRPRGRPRKVA